MPTQPIPFSGANKNADEGMQNALGRELYNAVVDELGNLRRVPGYSSFVDLATGYGVTGLHYNEKNDKVVAVSGAKFYLVDEDSTTTDVTGTGTPTIGQLATFADFADDVYVANNSAINKVPMDGVTTTTAITDSDAPSSGVVNVANLNGYLLANNGTAGRVDFADQGTPETWAGEFFTFEASNDQLQFFGVGEGYDRITGFGTNSIESWRNTGIVNAPFSPEGQEYVNRGSISPRSPVWILDTWYFVDQWKNLCRVTGRTPQRLPQQNYRGLTAYLQGLYCEDLIGMHIYANGYHWYVANLPTEQKSFGYNIDLDQWGEWSYWDAINAEHEQFRANVSCYATGWQKTLLGDSRSGLIYEMSADSFTANSDVIRSSIRTGFIDRGSNSRYKFCHRITGRVKKSNVSTADDTLKVAIRWRDKLLEGAWQQREVELYEEDDQNYYYVINGLGSYQRRQWEIICTSNIDFQMSPPEEDFTIGYR